MPTIKTAKKIAEDALKTIGAFPASMSAPDPGELRDTLNWLEMILNNQSGIRPLAGFWDTIEIPLEAGIGDYDLSDYANDSGVCDVFSVCLVDSLGNTDPLDFEYENNALLENLTQTGCPSRATVTKDRESVLKVYPTPTQTEEDSGLVLRLRIQTYHNPIDPTGVADVDLLLRPSWYLWITKRTAYEIGCGPVRRLAESELQRLEKDAEKLEDGLLARDGKERGSNPPVTEPVACSVDIHPSQLTGYRSRSKTIW